MHRRYDHANIPIEVLRTFIAVNDAAGNFSKAALALGLTQPGVSAQIKRLQSIIGKALLHKTPAGTRLTDDGTLVLLHARRIVAMNDQLLSHSRPAQLPDQIRIGMPRWVRKTTFVDIVKQCSAAHPNGRVSFRCDTLEHLTHDLCTGGLDIALLCDVSSPPGLVLDEWWEKLLWVKSPGLVLKPGVPIPFISWAGTSSDRYAAQAFNDAGIQYFVSFSAPDLASRVAAVVAGLGIMILSAARVSDDVEIATDPHLPALPAMRKGIYLRQSIDLGSVEAVARVLAVCVKSASSPHIVSTRAGTPISKAVSQRARARSVGR